jgi:hypothetical protein
MKPLGKRSSVGTGQTIGVASCSKAFDRPSPVSATRAAFAPISTAASSLRRESPGDFDGCWEVAGVDPDLLDPVLLTFAKGRAEQKARFGGELFPAEASADPHGTRFLDYFQQDKFTGEPKGIVSLDLKELT